MSSRTTCPVPLVLFHVRCVTHHGLLKVWRLPASSAGHPTSRALALLSQTSTSKTNALKYVRCASRCCCCLKLGAVVLTGEFNKAVEMETSSSDGERRTSPMEVAFRHTNVPWPAFGVTPLWGPSGEHHGHKWPDCCDFMVLPESQSQWLSLRHGSIDVNLADTWHYEQWLHLKFAGRKRRRDVSPADSKSRHKIVFYVKN